MFTREELQWIEELVQEEVSKRKENGQYEVFTSDTNILESILNKIDKSSK